MKYYITALIALAVIVGCARKQEHAEVGPQGPVGMQGASCTVLQQENGALIRCADGTEAFIADGQCQCDCTCEEKEHD